MILPLRRYHRRVFSFLVVVLPLLVLIGIMRRQSPPSLDTIPPELLPQSRTYAETTYRREDLFANSGVTMSLWKDSSTEDYAVRLVAPQGLARPDVSVYWFSSHLDPLNQVPPTAQWLGSFASAILPVPKEALQTEGRLILFSLAAGEILETSKPFRLGPPNNR